ncbi:glycosyltransferase [Roseomonas sp. F4]
MDEKTQIQILKQKKQIHSNWYRTEYPDVAMLGMDSALHYVRYGALLGRSPRPGFDTGFYVSRYPDVSKSGLNPAVHYALKGIEEERLTKATDVAKFRELARKSMLRLRTRLLSQGFTDKPLASLDELARNKNRPFHATYAARELALWYYRSKTPEGYQKSLEYILLSLDTAQDDHDRARALTIQSLCLYLLGRSEEGRTILPAANLPDSEMLDIYLAHANHMTSEAERVATINKALALYDIPDITLAPENGGPAYDRLRMKAKIQEVSGPSAPLVSILIACYNAETTLPTALESLLVQSWRNFEAIVIDDASSDGTVRVAREFAARDPRVKVLEMPVNGGAYVARNHGLDISSGAFVTIHDADDWSHPTKLQRQVEWLIKNEDFVACTSQQARATNDLEFLRPTANSQLRNVNMSSLMTRTKFLKEKCGYWDTVRFGADTEMHKRLNVAAGREAVQHLESGPLSFQRISETSIVADEFFGMEGFFFGARHLYAEAAALKHKNSDQIKYQGKDQARPFLAPYPMRPHRVKGERRHFDVVIASEFRMAGGSTRSSIEEMHCQRAAGVSTGVLQMYRYDLETPRSIFAVLGEDMALEDIDMVVYGEKISCDLLILRYPPILQETQRYIPDIAAKNIKVILNQPPMSEYSEQGEVRFTLEAAAANCRRYFGADAEWHPIGPLIRTAMHEHHAAELHHINLSDQDWPNIIDIKGWSRGKRKRSPSDRLRIGRHSRDASVKWPNSREDILAIYAPAEDVEVHVLGGADSVAQVIGDIPPNWTVLPFGSVHPREFLAEIDVFIYFHHPDWVEAFGRTIIEAMAVGVPVILPEFYRPLFGDAALYADKNTALDLARRIHADAKGYDAQVDKARDYARNNFSYERHLERLKAAGVGSVQS